MGKNPNFEAKGTDVARNGRFSFQSKRCNFQDLPDFSRPRADFDGAPLNGLK